MSISPLIRWPNSLYHYTLDYYIDLAFKEVTNFKKVVNDVHKQLAYDSFDEHLKLLNKELASGMPIEQYLAKQKRLTELRNCDVTNLG